MWIVLRTKCTKICTKSESKVYLIFYMFYADCNHYTVIKHELDLFDILFIKLHAITSFLILCHFIYV